jgi:hypothetical protein
LLLGLLALAILIGVSPHQQPNPLTDSGIFLYIGEQLRNGATLYVDAWDHKGPVIFYINALGLLIGGGSRWGVWLLELVAVAGGALLGYGVMRRAFGRLPALFGSFLWLIALPSVLEGGNLTEEYGLLFQFAAVWFFVRGEQSDARWQDLAVGLMMGLAFWMRANIIGLPAAMLLVLLWQALRQKHRRAWLRIASILGGFLLVAVLIAAFFAARQALPALWDGAFYYNLVYSEDLPADRFSSILTGFRRLPILLIFGVTGWLLCVAELLQSAPEKKPASLLPVLAVAAPIELVLVMLSGRAFPHYYMSWLPVFGLLSGYLLWTLIRLAEPAAQKAGPRAFAGVLTAGLLLTIGLIPVKQIWSPVPPSLNAAIQAGGMPPVDVAGSRFGLAVQYLAENSSPDEDLLFWGKLLAINWLSGRDVPSRHIFQDHFFTPGYATPKMIQEYIDDIEASHPLIIDSTVNRDSYPEIGTPLEELPEVVRPLYDYVQTHYVFVEQMNRYGWFVYRYAGGPAQ